MNLNRAESKHLRTPIFAALSLAFFPLAWSYPDEMTTQNTQRWEVMEFSFAAEAPATDPFMVEFGAVFSHTNGTTFRIPGFYDGDDRWKIRFCPPETGEWDCVTFSTLRELAGRTSKLSVSENTSERRRGPIVISQSNRQRFTYADGTPYPLMAFELDWLFALDAENPDDIPQTRQIVAEVAKHGFNQIVMNVFAYDAVFGEKDKIRPQNNFAQPRVFPFGGENDHPDFSTINTTFFQRLDRVLAHLNEQGIVAHLMVYVWNKKVNWPEPESAADNRYFDYVVKRYQAFPNLIWDISKEALGYGRDDMDYITRRIERLRRLDGHGRLVTVHDYDYCSAYPDKVDFISIQEWQPYLYARMREVAAVHPGKPIFNIEHGGYEKTMHTIFDGAYTDPVTCLDRAWQCIFAGTYPTYYWQNAAWYHVITDPFGLPESEQPHFRYYRHLVDFLSAHPLLRFRPRQEAFTPPILEGSTGVYLFYLSGNRTGIYGNLPEVKGKTWSIAWFDPLTGEYYDGGEREFPEESPNAFLGVRRHAKITGPMAIAILKEIQ